MIAPRSRSIRTPSASLPLSYLGAAAVAFIVAAFGVVWLAPELSGHYYHPRIVALAHAITLGWITLTVMGASYQLIPIVLQRPIWSERLGRWQFWILLLGITGMVGHFYLGTWPGLLSGAALLALGAFAHLLNVGLSLYGFRQWDFTARLIVLGYTGLALTVMLGLALGADHIWTFLPGQFFHRLQAHFHLALLGWVTPMVFGVAARVYPMFLLAPEATGWPARLQLWGLALGVPAVVIGLLGMPMLVRPGAVAVAVAAMGHAVWVARMVRQRKRPALDWGLRFALTGTGFLLPATGLGLGFAFDLISGPHLALAYAVLALGGWVSLTIAGIMLKIVSFLVWYEVYSPQAGKCPVPTLPQLAWRAGERAAYALLSSGMILLPMAVASGDTAWISAAGVVLSLGAIAFGGSIGRILSHLTGHRAKTERAMPTAAAAG
jgi:hypothetical protein